MPPAIAPPPPPHTRHSACTALHGRPRAWVGVPAAVVLCAALLAGARAEAPPSSPPPLGNTTVALLSTPEGSAAGGPRALKAPHASGGPRSHNGSHIPTPFDNPWALGLLAALTAWVLWMDRSQGGTKPESPEPSDRL